MTDGDACRKKGKEATAADGRNSAFMHGHTYQGHAVACAAALEVQKIILEDGLMSNCRSMGEIMGKLLHEAIGDHPHVGSIRGRGLFWGIEFVRDRATKEPFPQSDGVAMGICETGMKAPYCIGVYPGTGTVDGVSGDHIIVAPAFNIAASDVEWIVQTLSDLIVAFFQAKPARE